LFWLIQTYHISFIPIQATFVPAEKFLQSNQQKTVYVMIKIENPNQRKTDEGCSAQ